MACMPTHPFLRMPLHLLSLVLSQLDSTPSLASAIFSHSSFYAAFYEDRDRIIRAILRRQISPEIEPYAFAAYLAATTLGRSDPEEISEFLYQHVARVFERGASTEATSVEDLVGKSGPINLSRANTLSRTHTIVNYFTRGFIRDTRTLASKELGLKLEGTAAASSDEVFRINRAIYRYLLYCNLFRQPYDKYVNRAGSPLRFYFFRLFAPWVNEQLACVHDYFERVLSQAFDQVAAHDVKWGYMSIGWRSVAERNEYKQGYLLRGLEFLYHLDRADTYNKRLEILGDNPPRTQYMLGNIFRNHGSTNGLRVDYRHFWRQIDVVKRNGKRWIDCNWPSNGPDVHGSGPFRMWRASHEDCWHEDVTFHSDHAWLRRCGYVFWDFPQALMTENQLKEFLSRGIRKAWLDHFRRNDGELKRKMRRSRKERAEIYKRGGRGYWSEGDLSQIVWTEGAPS
ncbi:hypothetical protein F5144DRAFT_559149 [Chaetomium tenue]|uniref:Uncharacterized protein n=1 Tax=Chaetomium tenue TaxID=1854479 RepID=A0ACB7PS86_9PEZI|nr:hypothetical protein F5144DRAFT_559149 [Chaetomium globosum]